MEIQLSRAEGKVTITVIGRMDAMTAPEFQQEVETCIDEGARQLIIDLAGLEYISSAGLRSMLCLAKRLQNCDGRIALCGLAGVVKEVFDISGFSDIFAIYPDGAAACRHL